jgi:hypothetical protein
MRQNSARGGKGDKSKLINLSIRKLLEEYEVIEKNNFDEFQQNKIIKECLFMCKMINTKNRHYP